MKRKLAGAIRKLLSSPVESIFLVVVMSPVFFILNMMFFYLFFPRTTLDALMVTEIFLLPLALAFVVFLLDRGLKNAKTFRDLDDARAKEILDSLPNAIIFKDNQLILCDDYLITKQKSIEIIPISNILWAYIREVKASQATVLVLRLNDGRELAFAQKGGASARNIPDWNFTLTRFSENHPQILFGYSETNKERYSQLLIRPVR